MQRHGITIISPVYPDGLLLWHKAASIDEALSLACSDFDALPRPAIAKVWTRVGAKVVVWRRQPRAPWSKGEVIKLACG